MDLLHGNIKRIYFKYLSAAFGSAMIACIYGIVDMAMVGQYQGPDGTAALAVVAPIWNIIYSLGLLMGIGGSVIFSTVKGQEKHETGLENEYFTVSVIGSVVLAILTWIVIIFFERPILLFFGANESLLPLASSYLTPIKVVIPLFLFNQMLAAFLRNDNDPGRATAGVLAGGIFNIFGDYFFVFPLDMGMFGAGLATAIGSGISFVVMLSHFWSKKNTLSFRKPLRAINKLKEISVTGFSTFFSDVAMGILTILFNRQIMTYLGSDALAIYGPIVNVSTIVQCCAYSVGQAAQPIISINFGAKRWQRIKGTLRYALYTIAIFAVFWTALSWIWPDLYIRIFMSPTESILRMAPAIIRSYSLSFILLPLNIFSTYYFQALMKPKTAFIVSISRGCVISGILIICLPLISSASSIWFAMPITELLVSIYAIREIVLITNTLRGTEEVTVNPHKIITISREFGSGGRELGRRLAEELKIAYYDREIVTEISRRTEFAEHYVESVIEGDQIISFPIHIGRSFYPVSNQALILPQDILFMQHRIIEELAEKSDCVIVGRCADYILQKYRPFRIFVYADMEDRISRCQLKAPKDEHMTEKDLKKHIITIDRKRAAYYQDYTGQKWGNKSNYDLCINTSSIIIKEFVPGLARVFE